MIHVSAKGGRKLFIVIQTAIVFWHATAGTSTEKASWSVQKRAGPIVSRQRF